MVSDVEKTIEEITRITIDKLGKDASPDKIKEVVAKTWERMNSAGNKDTVFDPLRKEADSCSTQSGSRAILSAVGKEQVGVVAAISDILAKHNASIQDITQSLLQEFFTMIMIINMQKMDISFGELKTELEKLGEKIGVKILLQHEEIFEYMHRI